MSKNTVMLYIWIRRRIDMFHLQALSLNISCQLSNPPCDPLQCTTKMTLPDGPPNAPMTIRLFVELKLVLVTRALDLA